MTSVLVGKLFKSFKEVLEHFEANLPQPATKDEGATVGGQAVSVAAATARKHA